MNERTQCRRRRRRRRPARQTLLASWRRVSSWSTRAHERSKQKSPSQVMAPPLQTPKARTKETRAGRPWPLAPAPDSSRLSRSKNNYGTCHGRILGCLASPPRDGRREIIPVWSLSRLSAAGARSPPAYRLLRTLSALTARRPTLSWSSHRSLTQHIQLCGCHLPSSYLGFALCSACIYSVLNTSAASSPCWN
jgi:hypothetical protein